MKITELDIIRRDFPDKTDEELMELITAAAVQNAQNFGPITLPKLGIKDSFLFFLADFKAKLWK
jgi:hypothetical protein